jgi:protein gp37
MAEKTAIAWTDSTFNPWWGCTKVAPGCDNCYAEALDNRTGGDYWGAKQSPRAMSVDNWRKPRKWNQAAIESGVRHKTFCGSMCDWADKNAPVGQRDRLWSLIRDTQMLDWQLLTKRAPNIVRFLPDDWGTGWPGLVLPAKLYTLAAITATPKPWITELVATTGVQNNLHAPCQ